jgi:hypothetical protein
MAISDEMTLGLKGMVRRISDEISSSGFLDKDMNPDFYVWNIVRSALGKSYSECTDADIPRAHEALQSLAERVKSETGRLGRSN